MLDLVVRILKLDKTNVPQRNPLFSESSGKEKEGNQRTNHFRIASNKNFTSTTNRERRF